MQHLSADFDGDPRGARVGARAARPLAPAPARRRRLDDRLRIARAPPLAARRPIRTSPIKGTRPAGVPIESAKDAAEHVMIVDLERNDLSRVRVPGSVRWPELLAEQQLAGVTHLVATVEGSCATTCRSPSCSRRCCPAARSPAARRSRRSTSSPRSSRSAAARRWARSGASMPNGDLDLALTIRTFAVADGGIHLWVGGGIVWDSDPAAEVEESWVKARPLLAAIGAPLPAPVS